LGIVDSQSVQNASSAEEKGYDGAKKTSGIKRHIVVDTMGLPHALLVTTANVTDRAGALLMIDFNAENLSCVKKFLVDGGYEGVNFADQVKKLLGDDVDVEVVKRDELHKFVVLPKRWIVERTFGWIDNARRLWKNCESTLHNSLQMFILALISVFIRRF
jgi:transposase